MTNSQLSNIILRIFNIHTRHDIIFSPYRTLPSIPLIRSSISISLSPCVCIDDVMMLHFHV